MNITAIFKNSSVEEDNTTMEGLQAIGYEVVAVNCSQCPTSTGLSVRIFDVSSEDLTSVRNCIESLGGVVSN